MKLVLQINAVNLMFYVFLENIKNNVCHVMASHLPWPEIRWNENNDSVGPPLLFHF